MSLKKLFKLLALVITIMLFINVIPILPLTNNIYAQEEKDLDKERESLISNNIPLKEEGDDSITYLYRFEDNKENKTITKDEYVLLADVTGSELNSGTYVVDRDITISDRRFVVNGTVNIILCDGFTLTIKQGITVTGSNILNIYGQDEETGKLIANNDGQSLSASIGGAYSDPNAGTINICSGILSQKWLVFYIF